MQHVYGHTGNLGNECADHAAALGSLGLISSHNIATRWVRHILDTSASCGGCNSISEVLEKLQSIRTEATSLPQDGSWCCDPHRVLCVSHARICITCGFALSLFPARPFCSSGKAMASPTSSVSTASSSGESFAHNMWNPFLELLFHEQVCSFLVLNVDDFDLARIALSCEFCSGFTLLQGRCSQFCMMLHRAPLPVSLCLL